MTTEPAHSKFSASSSHRWMHCPGSMALESVLPDDASLFAEEGTAAHTMGSWCLEKGKNAEDYPDATITTEAGNTFDASDDMRDHVQTYIDTVLTYGGELMVEQRVHYGDWLGVPDDRAFGTSDAVIIEDDRITIVDLKFGRGVRVFASTEELVDGKLVRVGNPQLMLYALGALYEFDFLGPFKRVRMAISQPRLGHHDEWECDVSKLMAFALEAREAVQAAKNTKREAELGMSLHLSPSEDACRFCKAKATCPALVAEVLSTVSNGTEDDFADLTQAVMPDVSLSSAMAKVGLVEDWCKAVRAEVERRLFAGQEVPGFKLVEGKRGNRAWTSADDALAMLKSFRLKHEDMYSYSLKGPAPMEKLLKKDSPRRWASLQALIGQSEGRPSVAPASDGRPALSILPTADDFEDISEDVGASSHPFRT